MRNALTWKLASSHIYHPCCFLITLCRFINEALLEIKLVLSCSFINENVPTLMSIVSKWEDPLSMSHVTNFISFWQQMCLPCNPPSKKRERDTVGCQKCVCDNDDDVDYDDDENMRIERKLAEPKERVANLIKTFLSHPKKNPHFTHHRAAALPQKRIAK